jgi:hypothetical protein
MQTKMFQKVMALICTAILLVSVLPAGSALADEKLGTPSITVKSVNDTDVKVTIGKTKGADGYEVWITSDCGYTGYKNYNYYIKYNYMDNPCDYINAATIEKDGTEARSVTIKNLSKTSVSVKVRAYAGIQSTDGYTECVYGGFSKSKTVKVTAQKKGYESSYDFSTVKKGDIIEFGTYEQDYPVDGKDPIEWVVLEKKKNGILVMSKYALDCLPYNIEFMEETWETCSLRKWLNEKFYNTAFNKTEKAMIKKTTVQNNDNSYYGKDGGNDTRDKVLLLAIEDVLKESYGFDTDRSVWDINRRCAPSRYAVAQGAYQYQDTGKDYLTADNEGACWWLLRSPGYYSSNAASVAHGGAVDVIGNGVDREIDAVRPAMWIKLKSK